MILEYLKLSVNELINNRLRSFLSLIGIVIGVAVVFIIFSISDITNAAIVNEISGTNGVFQIYYVDDKEDTGSIFMTSLGFSTSQTQVNRYDVEDIELLMEVDGIAGAAGNFSTSETVRINEYTVQSTLRRYSETFLDYHELEIVEGTDIFAYPEKTQKNLAMVSSTMVEMYLEMDVSEVVGKTLVIRNKEFVIVGVLETTDTTATAVLSEQGYDALYSASTLNAISVKVEAGYPLRETAQEAVDYLNYANGYSNQKGGYALEDLSVLTESIGVVTGILSLVMGVIAAISLLVAGIGVMNIMLVSVVERTREIGVKRAIGAGKSAIQFQFMVESCLLTFTGGVIGVLIGVVVIQITLAALDMNVAINMGYVVFALVFSISLGLMFGYLPSRRAADLNIIEAIQSE